ncbi:MAG TPA: DUF885 domain-containing protein [Thermoanaerobaculia bacterium]|nr:DUF885 domain-containing protein [Thermoanaerobaculia bacterium]
MRKQMLLLPLLLAVGCASSTGPAQLKSIADDVWAHRVEDDLSIRMKLGLPVEKMPDPSYEKAAADAAFARSILRRLDRVDAKNLTAEERVTLGVLRWQQQLEVEGLEHFYLRFQVTPYASAIRTTREVKFEGNPRILESYIRYIDGLTTVLREQQRRGILIPQPEIPAVRALFGKAPLPAAQAAHDRLLAVLSPEYEAAAPRAVGLSQQPGGAAAYRYFIKASTTLERSPEEIHALGLREIERIDRELDDIRNQTGFTGTRDAFLQFLKTDPRFFESAADGIRARLDKYVKTIEPHLADFFSVMPRAKYGVQRLDPALEGAMTFGYYKWPTPNDPTGLYYFNGSKTNERNLLFGMALMAHELVPGHHFQITRQSENESLHPVRRESFDTVFVEGWGEYAAALGKEMGIYTDPYDRAGRLMMDSMLSARLVVDTGMNALGWSRERAIDYLMAHSMLSGTEAATETLRYSTDIPAQALAYKLGSLRIMELREDARRRLGQRFDIRQFHEWILGQGSMPLGVLETYLAEKTK